RRSRDAGGADRLAPRPGRRSFSRSARRACARSARRAGLPRRRKRRARACLRSGDRRGARLARRSACDLVVHDLRVVRRRPRLAILPLERDLVLELFLLRILVVAADAAEAVLIAALAASAIAECVALRVADGDAVGHELVNRCRSILELPTNPLVLAPHDDRL